VTVVNVRAGSCGFTLRIKAHKDGQRRVSFQLESECEALGDLALVLEHLGPLAITDIVRSTAGKNPVLTAVSETVSHSACPAAVALIKAAEVELGLNVPSMVTIEFESDAEP